MFWTLTSKEATLSDKEYWEFVAQANKPTNTIKEKEWKAKLPGINPIVKSVRCKVNGTANIRRELARICFGLASARRGSSVKEPIENGDCKNQKTIGLNTRSFLGQPKKKKKGNVIDSYSIQKKLLSIIQTTKVLLLVFVIRVTGRAAHWQPEKG